MKQSLTLLLSVLCLSVTAQKNKKDTTGKEKVTIDFNSKVVVWKKGLQATLYAGQAASKNWASGSDFFSLSANGFIHAHADRSRGKWYWDNQLDASYGFINTDEFSAIKNDDKIDFFSTVGVLSRSNPNFGFGAAFNFRSQFSNGYDRDYLNQGLKRRTSGLFAPAYITIAPIGLQYKVKHITFYGTIFGLRGVIVSNSPYSYLYQGGTIPASYINAKNPSSQERSVAEMYGVDPSKEIDFQYGPYVSVIYNAEITRNVSWTGRLDAFSNMRGTPENVDLFMQNMFTLHVNNWLNAIYSLDMAYDDDIKKFGYFKTSPAFQLKSVLGVGVRANFGDYRKRSNRRTK